MPSNPSSRRRFLSQVLGAGAAMSIGGTALASSLRPDMGLSGSPDIRKFVPVMITPYLPGGGIDVEMLKRLADFYLACGARGLFANCLSSEMYHLTNEERLTLASTVVQYTGGKVSVVASGSFGKDISEKAAFVRKMSDTGVNGVILITGHFADQNQDDEVLFQNFLDLCSLTGKIPLGMYECPSPYKRLITPPLLKKLLTTDRLIYFKDTSLDLEAVRAKLALIKGSRLEFYDAHTPNARFSLAMGAKGLSPIAGNFYPEIFAWMTKKFADPSQKENVAWIQEELTQADPIISTHYPLSAKYFLRKRGLPIEVSSRTTKDPLSEKEIQDLEKVHQRFLGWCARLSITPQKA